MSEVWTSLLDFLGLLLIAAGVGVIVVGFTRLGLGLAAAGAVLIAGSLLAARLAAPRLQDGDDS